MYARRGVREVTRTNVLTLNGIPKSNRGCSWYCCTTPSCPSAISLQSETHQCAQEQETADHTGPQKQFARLKLFGNRPHLCILLKSLVVFGSSSKLGFESAKLLKIHFLLALAFTAASRNDSNCCGRLKHCGTTSFSLTAEIRTIVFLMENTCNDSKACLDEKCVD